MARTISIANTSFELLDVSATEFRHTSFSSWSGQTSRNGLQIVSAPSIQVVATNPAKLDKCGYGDSRNPPNDCGKVNSTSLFANQWISEGSRRAAIVTAALNATDQNNFAGAIDALEQLKEYCLEMSYAFAEREAYAKYLRNFSYGTKDKWRCCYRNQHLDSAKNIADTQKNVAWQDARSLKASIQAIKDLQESVDNSTISSLEVEEQRAETNYQVALTNQEISREGYITSQRALSEGSGRLIYVVMAVVAAFFVYRFVIKR